MRHGLKISKLSRPTSHRVLMLRNLVSSLLQHEQISTTLPKAKAAQKLADMVIQWGKLGGKENRDRANAFLLNPKETLQPLFTTFAKRYASRPGGYTRILRSGYRVGDNAPLAVLELVDNQNDLRFENAAKTVGRELAIKVGGSKEGWKEFRREVEAGGPEGIVERIKGNDKIGEVTRKNVVKALQFRSNEIALPVDQDSTTVNLSSSSTDPSISTAESNSQEQQPTPTTTTTSELIPKIHPSTLFLDRSYHHYLRSLATFSLSTTSIPDPLRPIHQLTQRLHPKEDDSPPKPVLTVPTTGRRPFAGERVQGWASSQGEEVLTKGPISIAKGSSSKWNLDRKRRGTSGKHATVKMEELEKEFEERL